MVLGAGTFERGLGHEGGAPMNGISAHKRDPHPFDHVRTQQKDSCL